MPYSSATKLTFGPSIRSQPYSASPVFGTEEEVPRRGCVTERPYQRLARSTVMESGVWSLIGSP